MKFGLSYMTLVVGVGVGYWDRKANSNNFEHPHYIY